MILFYNMIDLALPYSSITFNLMSDKKIPRKKFIMRLVEEMLGLDSSSMEKNPSHPIGVPMSMSEARR